jgi:hypothetical protein
MKKILLLFVLIISSASVFAQEKEGFDGFMRSRGLSYVVVAVMLTILIGLLFYLIRLDRKIKKLEK